MTEENGLRQIGEFTTEQFESLYNNHIGFAFAQFYESHHEVFGGSAAATAHPVIVHCFVDEFDNELVKSISSDDEGYIDFETTAQFDYYVHWLLGEFFSPESFGNIASAMGLKSPIPTMAIVHFYAPDPTTMEDELVWAARFTRDEYLTWPENPGDELRGLIEIGLKRNDDDVEKLVAEFGEGDWE